MFISVIRKSAKKRKESVIFSQSNAVTNIFRKKTAFMSVRLFFYGSSVKKRYVPREHIVISRQFRRLEQSKWRKKTDQNAA